MRHPSTPLALVAIATPSHERTEGAGVLGPGWFDSSWELHRGLDIREGGPDEDRVGHGIDDFPFAQRAVGRTASPSASTAMA